VFADITGPVGDLPISTIFASHVRWRTDVPAANLIEGPTQNYPAARKNGATMATQSDLSHQPKKSKANSQHRIKKNAQPEIVASTATQVIQQDVELLTNEQRRELIAVTAYYLAEGRNFQPGHEDEDWLTAELQIGSFGALVS
jgi:Protein of unknown function (DUF2934)